MSCHLTVLTLLLALFSFVSQCVTDDEHGSWGPYVPEPPHRKPLLQEGYGQADFPVSCKKPLTQLFFNQAAAMLFGLDEREANRSFQQAAILEPSCPMADWGMAIANVDYPARARVYLQRAIAHKDEATVWQRQWIDAFAACVNVEQVESDDYFEDFTETVEIDLGRLAAAWKKLALANPDDIAAQATYVLLAFKEHGGPWENSAEMDQWIARILAEQPRHPIRGLRALLWESGQPQRSLRSAEAACAAAPQNPHLWSLLGRLRAKQHRYRQAVAALERADHLFFARMQRYQLMPDDIPGYAETRERLVQNLMRSGRPRDAIAIARDMAQSPCSRNSNVDLGTSPDPDTHRVRGIRQLSTLFAELQAWAALDALEKAPGFHGFDGEMALRSAVARGAFARGQLQHGETQLSKLRYMYARAVSDAFLGGGHLHGLARDPQKSEVALKRRVTDVRIVIARRLLDQALAEGNLEGLREGLESESAPGNWQAPYYWAVGQQKEALRLAEQAYREAPGDVATDRNLLFSTRPSEYQGRMAN